LVTPDGLDQVPLEVNVLIATGPTDSHPMEEPLLDFRNFPELAVPAVGGKAFELIGVVSKTNS
jgi:hypothetical protein